jgi:hypothetical protein
MKATRFDRPTLAAFACPTKHRALDDACGGEPVPDGSDRTGDRAAADRDHGAAPLLVGLGAPDRDPKTLWAFLEVGDVEGDELRSASIDPSKGSAADRTARRLRSTALGRPLSCSQKTDAGQLLAIPIANSRFSRFRYIAGHRVRNRSNQLADLGNEGAFVVIRADNRLNRIPCRGA